MEEEKKLPWDDYYPDTKETFIALKEREGRVHNWCNYIPDEIIEAWGELTNKERWLLQQTAEVSASNEEWD